MVTRLGRVGVQRMLVVAIVVDAGYWTLWSAERSWVASSTRPAYVEFENAFPLADGWLALACLAALVSLRRRSPVALLWLITLTFSLIALTWAWANRDELLTAAA